MADALQSSSDAKRVPAASNDGRRLRVAAAGIVSAGIAVVIARESPHLAAAQRATRGTLQAAAWQRGDLVYGIRLDFLLIVSYVLLGWVVFTLIREPAGKDQDRRRHPAATAGFLLVAGAAVADAFENLMLWRSLPLLEKERSSSYLGAMRSAGIFKWAFLGTAVLILVVLVMLRVWRAPCRAGKPDSRPDWKRAEKPDWTPPAQGDDARVGVCLSGGGIRSAAFSLGALQALRNRKKLDKVKYLAAASGGGYLAAGWAVSHAGPPGDATAAPPQMLRWAEGSPEERWFRDHSSYLVPDTKGGLMGLVRLLGGAVVNLVLIWLVLFALARPVGWVIHTIHPSLRASVPTAIVRDELAEMEVAKGSVSNVSSFVADDGVPVSRHRVDIVALAPTEEKGSAGNDVCFHVIGDKGPDDDKPGGEPDADDFCFPVEQAEDRATLIDISKGRATIVRQPEVIAGGVGKKEGLEAAFDPEPCEDTRLCVLETLDVDSQPVLALKDDVVVDTNALPDMLKIDHQPTIRSKSGLAGVEYPSFKWWMWEASVGLIAGGLIVALGVMSLRLRGPKNGVGRALAGGLAGAGLVVFAVAIALPWLTVWIPRTLGHAAGTLPAVPEKQTAGGSGIKDYLLPGGGLLAVMVAATKQFLAAGRTGSGTGASTPWYRSLWSRFGTQGTKLRWYEASPLKVAVAILMVVVPIVLFVEQLQYAAGNGWKGRLMGFAFIRDFLPDWLFLPEWSKLVIVVVVLGGLLLVVDAHAWSLYPFYKYRLSTVFFTRRDGDGLGETIPSRELMPFATPSDDWQWSLRDPTRPVPEQKAGESPPKKPAPSEEPQLILCCAVNLSEYGRVPPGRRPASFTFSTTEIGGPVVGYAEPEDYWKKLSDARRRDITIPAATAISGAAFSPAMGKFNLGPIGSVLALTNLRLGVWIPNPRRIRDEPGSRRSWWWAVRRPNWTWFLRELFNKYRLDRRYLYVSDGGHWDNLGLVELLRRGCTEIYCISCAGDGADSFGTIGEAIALAREELGVEILLDPTPLRAPVKVPKKPPTRELRRQGAKDKAASFSPARSVKGTYTFPGAETRVAGTIWYVEADLTANMAFDVHTFAESEPIFPDDSTGDQVFNHRQFESYRRLGYHQAETIGIDPS